ncbi:MAG: putative glycosyl hydrolase, partial [Clostridiaceae bacterium]|nr:putative glycosyl hydrolase [Clostridiaceae bacterium]
MTIYVVKPGDSLWSIGRRYGVNPNDIAGANKMDVSIALVVGQTLIIPSIQRQYTVKPGDSIWSISRRFGVSVSSILDLNNVNPSSIYPGLVISIPEKSKNYGYIEVNGFIQPSTPEKERSILDESIRYLTYVSPFSHHVNADGTLTPLNDDVILQVAKDNKVAPMLSVTNISGANFDTKLISNILNNNELQQTVINNIFNMIQSKGLYGVIIDFERIPPEDREKYNGFLRKVVARLHPNYFVATALAPKTYDITTGSWHGAHDYRAHGEIVDFVVIMTYEWGWSGG